VSLLRLTTRCTRPWFAVEAEAVLVSVDDLEGLGMTLEIPGDTDEPPGFQRA